MTNNNSFSCAIIKTISLFIILGSSVYGFSGCKNKNDIGPVSYNNIKSYKNIPGITDEEIQNIEALKFDHINITFGTIPSSEAYFLEDGSYAGFIIKFCELLSDLFDISFIPEILSKKTLADGMENRTINFTNEFSSLSNINKVYIMSHPITERSLYAFNLKNSAIIRNEKDLNELKIGFYNDNVFAQSIKEAYPLINFKEVIIDEHDDVVLLLEYGIIDTFIVDVLKSYEFRRNFLLQYNEIPTLVYIPVSLTTIDPEFEAIVSVMNKYVKAGGIDNIFKLYIDSEMEYEKYVFKRLLSEEEKIYLNNTKNEGKKISIALESDNYPVCFYNEVEEEFEGIAVDILSEISTLTELQFEIATNKNTSFEYMLNMLSAGDVSIISEIINPKDRSANYFYSRPYFDSHYIFISKEEYPNIRIHQVINTNVGVVKNTNYEEMYNLIFPNSNNVKYYFSREEAIKALQRNEIDLYMASENIFMEMHNFEELHGFKINIKIEFPLEESYFYFNENEKILSSIFIKSQEYLNISNIGTKWSSQIFDYSKNLEATKFIYILVFSAVLLIMLVFMLILFIKNGQTSELYKDQMIRLSSIYNSLPDLVYTKDVNGVYTSCNVNCIKFYGIDESDIIGKTLLNLKNNNDLGERLLEIEKKVIAEKKIIKTDEWITFPDNTNRLMESTKVPMIKNSKVIGLLGIDRDITEQRNALDAAYEASRAKSNFLAKISHEIRTPMNAIIGMTELALREKEKDLTYKHILTVKQAGTHLLSIINDILDFSKIERGKLEIIPGDYYLSSLINDVISIIRMKLIDSQIRFAVNIDSSIPNELYGDETRIRQVLLNILTNAVKYTEKGYISFTVQYEELDSEYINLVIEIMDSGKGIKQENLKDLFNEYSQIDTDKQRSIEGIGLGLAITWSLVKAMGGDIKVYSEYGQGSIFTINIPQKIRSKKILAKIENPSEKSVIIYERREIYASSITYSVDNLGVKCTLVTNDSELYEELRKFNYSFLFISYILMRKNIDIIQKYSQKTKIAILTEFGEAVPTNNLNIISMPVYSISIANILNGIAESFNYNENKEDIIKFTAPTVNILIVDDINTNLKVAEGLLIPYKMNIDLCKSGKEAIQSVSLKHYDIVFMDHKMPEMDGVEATKIIRNMKDENNYYKNMPIIALTANAISGIEEEFLKNGFSDFLSKPIDVIKLNLILEKWIPKQKQNKVIGIGNQTLKEDMSMNNENEIKINGINIERGIYLTGGSLEDYLDTLSLFYSDGMEKIKELNHSFETMNIKMYNIFIHALKSALANIGANELSIEARDLENACERGDYDFIKKHNLIFIDKLKIILDDINNLLLKKESYNENGYKINVNVIKPILDELLNALMTMNAGTVNNDLEELVKLTRTSSYRNKINEISELILIGEYDDAAIIIKNLLSGDL